MRTLTLQQYSDGSGVGLNNFLNSLFDPWPGPFVAQPGALFRAGLRQRIKAAEVAGQRVPRGRWLIDEDTVELLVSLLRHYWKGGSFRRNPAPREIASDKAFIELISTYIDAQDLHLVVPSFQCAEKNDNAPSPYSLEEPIVASFKNDNGTWNGDTIRQFLELLLLGAHFVVIHSAQDLGTELPSFFTKFKTLAGVKTAGHSHYSGHKVSLNGRNYPPLTLNTTEGPHLDELSTAAQATLLPVVLCDETSNAQANTFFQMEGWPPGKNMLGIREQYRYPALAGGYRHGADFDTHGKTFWNISTYGASPYSEKRAGSVFLAPKAWARGSLRIYRGFGGLGAGHAWFKPEMVKMT